MHPDIRSCSLLCKTYTPETLLLRTAFKVRSKLANALFTIELQRRLDAVHIPIVVMVVDPGMVATGVSPPAYFRFLLDFRPQSRHSSIVVPHHLPTFTTVVSFAYVVF